MVRARVLVAFAALLVLSTGTAFAQRASEERRLSEGIADRDEYRTKLLLELQRRESLLVSQQQTLDRQEQRLQEMHVKLGQPPSEEEEDAAGPAQAAAVGPGGRKIPPDTPQAKRGKDFDTQVYKTQLARYNVAHTRKDIADLKALLARNP